MSLQYICINIFLCIYFYVYVCMHIKIYQPYILILYNCKKYNKLLTIKYYINIINLKHDTLYRYS